MTKINSNNTIFKVMHALGFYHEQQRPDRDQFVDFDETKIINDCKNAFRIIPIVTNVTDNVLGPILTHKDKSDGK